MRGDANRYAALLVKFAEVSKLEVVQLNSSVTAGDTRLARSLTHSLKGGAASVGARTLSTALDTLESALTGTRPETELQKILRNVAEHHSALTTAITALPSPTLPH